MYTLTIQQYNNNTTIGREYPIRTNSIRRIMDVLEQDAEYIVFYNIYEFEMARFV